MLRVAKIRKVKEAEAIFPSGQDIYYDAWVITENDNHNVPRQDQDDQPLTSEGPYPPLRPILIGSTVLGLTPLSNVFSSNGNGPTFAWVSLPMVYTLTFSCLLILASCFNIINLIRVASRTQDVRVVVLAMGTPMYFFTSTVAMTFYVRFSSQLSHLLQIWNQTTRSLTKYLPTGNPFLSPMTQPRIHLSVGSAAKYTVLVFVLPALLELTLHDISMYMSKSCENATNFIDCVIQGKGVRQDIVLLQFFGRETLVAVFRIVTTLQANISWNFSDLLITVICLALNANFRVITDYLETTYEMAIQNNVAMDVDWNALRNDHLKMCQLVKKIDTVIAPMVLQSYAFNIYGLCYQVYYGIR